MNPVAEREAAVKRMIRDCLAQFVAESHGWRVVFSARARRAAPDRE